jgi:lysyl-tRNA synthetase class 1
MKLVDFVDNILKSYDGSVVGSSPKRSRVSLVSSSEYYWAGAFNDMLDQVWDNYDAIQAVMLPTLGEERRATYSAFMPVAATSGQMIQSGVTLAHVSNYRAVQYTDDLGINCYHGIYDGNTKLQWKVDWAMRWVHFDVDYEMSGKDLIDSVKASSKICRILGGTPPLNMTYEMFLDETGAKIAKTKGNGFSIEQWLTYGTTGSLMTFMFQSPKAAKPLHIELVPKMEDEYIKMRQKDLGPNDAAWFFKAEGFHNQIPDISFNLLLNLVIVSQAKTADEVVRYLSQQRELPQADKAWVHLMAYRVIAYATQQGLYNRALRQPTEVEAKAFSELADRFSLMLGNMDAEAFQYQVYEVGKKYEFQPLRAWFQALYECLLGSSDGPRFGAFTVAYGLENTIRMLRQYEPQEV